MINAPYILKMSVIFADLQPYGSEALLNLATDLGFEDPVLDIKDDLDSKYGLTSPVKIVIISGKKNGKDEVLRIFAKTASTDERKRRFTFVTETFERESYVYDVVLPMFKDIFEDYTDQDKSVLRFIKYFGSRKVEGEEYIVLEDIDAQGYKVSDISNPGPDARSRSVMQWLAHFHGLSFVMKKREPKLFNEWTRKLKDFTMRDTDGLKWKCFENYITHFGLGLEELLRREGYTSECLEENYSSYFREVRKNYKFYYSPKPYGVICHGDFHNFNTLYNEDGNAGDLRVVDYQFTRYTSPCLDLITFIANSTNVNYELTVKPLLKLYRQHLADFVAAYGYDIEELYPKQVFEEEWRAYVPFGMLYGICNVVQTSCRSDAGSSLHVVDIMTANIPPHVWDMRTVTGDLKTYYLNTFELIRSSRVHSLE